MKSFYTELVERLERGERLAVASIARRLGSAPRDMGTRCAVLSGGSILGTIGGGLMEAKTQDLGKTVLAGETVGFLKLRLDSQDLAESGMICGGSVDILAAPWGEREIPAARELLHIFDSNDTAVLVTTWENGGVFTGVGIYRDDYWTGGRPLDNTLLEAVIESLGEGRPVLSGDPADAGFLAEPIERERSPLIILGAGHVGRALCQSAALAGFSVVVVDDREEFADPGKLPGAEKVHCIPFEGAVKKCGADESTFIVICTRGHMSDMVCAREALESPSGYVGMIGSRRKKGMIMKSLEEGGITGDRLKALHTPVGLEIGAETPEEIAVSITAEMISLRRRGSDPVTPKPA